MNMLSHIEPAADRARGLHRRIRSMGRWQRGGLLLVPLLLAGGVTARLAATPEAPAAPPPPTVTVATPLVRDVTEWDDYVGRFAPSRSVEIRPRVSGQVTGVHFRDGDYVRAGQLLYTIDQRPFAAALAEARADVASARSALALARSDLSRATRLIDDEAVSAGEVDALKARVQSAQAALAAAEARVRARALDVEFTQVRAPIAGRASDRRVDPGNLVAGGEGSSATLLTTINALDPIYFVFDASEALYLKTLRGRDRQDGQVSVEIRLQDESDYRWKGRLDFTDNGLDPGSGTIRGRAILSNPDYFLTPGMFGNMRLSSGGDARALLVPDEAVQTDQARKLVLVVDAGGQVVARPVEIGPLVNGLRVIRSGIGPADRIVISGLMSAMPGSKVQAKPGRITARAVPNASPAVSLPPAGDATFAR